MNCFFFIILYNRDCTRAINKTILYKLIIFWVKKYFALRKYLYKGLSIISNELCPEIKVLFF